MITKSGKKTRRSPRLNIDYSAQGWARIDSYLDRSARRRRSTPRHSMQTRLADTELALSSSPFGLLPRDVLCQIVQLVDPDDACCVALLSRVWRDAIFDRFPDDLKNGSLRLRSRRIANVGSFSRFAWAIGAGCAIDERLTAAAAQAGSMRVLKWLLRDWTPGEDYLVEVLRGAARGGQVGVLTFLHRRFELDDGTSEWVRHGAARGHHTRVSAAAAAAGQLGALQWLRRAGFAWGPSVLTEAARGGHLELFRWALEHECPHNRHPLKAALEAGQLGLCTWIMSEGPAALRSLPRFTPSELRAALAALVLPTAGTVAELTARLNGTLRERKVGLSVRVDDQGGLWV